MSAICICALSFVSMFQGTLWHNDNEERSSGNWSPLRALLTIDAESVQKLQTAYDELRTWIIGEEIDQKKKKEKQVEARDLEVKLDAEWTGTYPEDNRPASPVARNQGDEENCWMFAAASLLRTKQKAPTPHGDLVEELKNIEEELRGFWKEFKRRYQVNKVQGMRYWMESEWWKLTQSPEMKEVFPRDWSEQIVENPFLKNGFAGKFYFLETKKLMLQKFWNLHGFSFVEKFLNNGFPGGQSYFTNTFGIHQDQEPKIKEKLQNERALISIPRSELQTIKKGLTDLLPAKKGEARHIMLLDTFIFDEKLGEYIVKNSHGTTGGSRGTTDGKLRIPEELFNKLNYQIFFIGKTHSTHTSIEENGWMWAAATVSQAMQSNRYPIQELVAEVKEQWYTLLAFLEWRTAWKKTLIFTVSGRWSRKQEQDWRRTVWWNFDSETGSPHNKQFVVANKHLDSKGLRSERMSFRDASAEQMNMLKEKLQESPVQSAIILFEPPSWKLMVAKFTKFHENNGDGSDPGGSQLMVLQRFARDLYILEDTGGLNGIRPVESARSTIEIPASELRKMKFEVWFAEVPPPEISSPYTFEATQGQQSSDRKDVYRVQFIDLKAQQTKWFAINVMQEIEMIRQNEIRKEVTLARSFDVYIGKEKQIERIQLNRKCTQQPQVLEIEWDITSIKVTKIQVLSSTEVSELPENGVESVLRELELLASAEILVKEAYEYRKISSPCSIYTKGKHSSDLQDVYRVDFIDLETKQEKWFAINVMEEIEINRQNEMEGDIRIARGFDVFVGKETHSGRVQLNRRRILQGQALKIEWDATSIQVTNIQVLSATDPEAAANQEISSPHTDSSNRKEGPVQIHPLDQKEAERKRAEEEKLWTVKKFNGLFARNNQFKTRIALDSADYAEFAVVLEGDEWQNIKKRRIQVKNIKEIKILDSEKTKVSIFTVDGPFMGGPKYKIKCETEEDAVRWKKRLEQFCDDSKQ